MNLRQGFSVEGAQLTQCNFWCPLIIRGIARLSLVIKILRFIVCLSLLH
ncbi:hypothetical protein HanXRQr2_Chr16g0742491 [Helianthus annuus]|uniref:Uncharacterized protein n=1 Tax=Helianthus annuus TaxID=4232 RepID=A0A9K3DQ27_HELAN|nr:hypothetical protein HanXRQr2_Chr16g0742491 [Helianthus annuus]KAJ0943644.1 hypothetical protein HanPSC8_Chr03g0107121 [Helianthus annuus]